MTGMQKLDPAACEGVAPSAVVWINGQEASVVAVSNDGRISTFDISRGWLPEPSYLAQLVRVIGDRQRVMILGPSSLRLALEREYVSIYRRPDRLIDVEPAGAVSRQDLVDRVRMLAA